MPDEADRINVTEATQRILADPRVKQKLADKLKSDRRVWRNSKQRRRLVQLFPRSTRQRMRDAEAMGLIMLWNAERVNAFWIDALVGLLAEAHAVEIGTKEPALAQEE